MLGLVASVSNSPSTLLLFFPTRHLYPLLDLAVVILTADPMFCFRPRWGSTFSVLPLSIPLQPLSITTTFSLRGVLLFEIFVKV